MQKLIFIIALLALHFSLASWAGRPMLHKTSFANNMERYHSVLGFFAELDRLIPVRQDDTLPEECRQVTETNVSVLGGNDPGVAQALESQPGVLYFNLYQKCVNLIVKDSFSKNDMSYENAKQILGDGLARQLGKQSWDKIRFADINPELQKQILNRLVLYIVGPEAILASKNYIGAQNIFGNPEIVNMDSMSLFLRDHLLKLNGQASLSEFYAAFILILRNGPVIKA